ncbi:MAG: AMP-dependent synthetase [Candidatus Rokubacteria bacterium RIFCSPLOWO2_12_FULL_71_19]|nr:MAG: AMP-dependent synthetase [Candidatus Rokubacteria bacterium RIFCSPLOWO2_12_FULL_71_19]
MGLRDYTLFDVIARNARLFRDRTALIQEGQRVTHGEYLARVERLAGGLASAGMVPGDRIAVLAQNSLEFLDLYGAAARLGAILVPINWRLSADEITYVISDAAPRIIVAGAEYQAGIAAAENAFPFAERYYALGQPAGPFAPFADLGAPGAPAPAAEVGADSGFLMIHTAAVGGRPRGALLSHGGLLAANAQLLHYWRLGPTDVNLGMLPLFHLTGAGLFLAVQQAGGATVVLPRFDPEAALRHIQQDRVTVFGEFPPMLGTLLEHAEKGGHDLSSLRAVAGLDAPDTIGRFEAAWPGATFWVGYGQSEVSGFVTLCAFRDRPGSAGWPTFLNAVSLVDDLDTHLPVGQTGEIVVRGPMVFTGYWNCAADNALTFRNGWHHTGDLGRFDETGCLWYAGRSPAKELIKPGGENVYPAEVEKVIVEHPALLEAVVIGVPDAQWGEAIKAVCVCRPGQQVTAAEVIEFVGGRIARFKKPKHVTFVAALPRTPAGAIDRQKVKDEHGRA